MKQFGGWYFPDHEQHLLDWMQNDRHAQEVDGRLSYQWHKLSLALRYCKNFRVAVDVGAHIGLMSWHLIKLFGRVYAFEPIEEHRRCFVRNTSDLPEDVTMLPMLGYRVRPDGKTLNLPADLSAPGCDVALMPCALGAKPGLVSLTTRPSSSGDTYVSGPGDIDMRTLDSFELPAMDFLKIDVEGFEAEVIKGAASTLARCKPVVLVEQKTKNLKQNFGIDGLPAVELLRELGARVHGSISGDWIMSWGAA